MAASTRTVIARPMSVPRMPKAIFKTSQPATANSAKPRILRIIAPLLPVDPPSASGANHLHSPSSGGRFRDRAVDRIAQRLLARIVRQIEVQFVHHVGVAKTGIRIGERERAARA